MVISKEKVEIDKTETGEVGMSGVLCEAGSESLSCLMQRIVSMRLSTRLIYCSTKELTFSDGRIVKKVLVRLSFHKSYYKSFLFEDFLGICNERVVSLYFRGLPEKPV